MTKFVNNRSKTSVPTTLMPAKLNSLERRQCRQPLPLHIPQERSTHARDVVDPIRQMKFLDRCDGVAADGEREALARRRGVSDCLRIGMEGLELERAHDSVPDHRAGLADDGGELADPRASFSDGVPVRKWRAGPPRLNGSFDLPQSGVKGL